MENFLRLALLLVGVTIMFLILFVPRIRRRKLKAAQAKSLSREASSHDNSDEGLGFAVRREPTLNIPKSTKKTFTVAEPPSIPQQAAPSPHVISEPLSSVESLTPVNVTDIFTEEPVAHKSSEFIDKLLIISVVAKPHHNFASYDLIQSISATGMEFGDMNIFHYNVQTERGRIALFSLAAATEPGEFNLDHIGNFSCAGLTLFTNLGEVPDPEQAFELMLKTAEQLAEDLGGELRAGMRTPWSDETLQHYQQKILQYQPT